MPDPFVSFLDDPRYSDAIKHAFPVPETNQRMALFWPKDPNIRTDDPASMRTADVQILTKNKRQYITPEYFLAEKKLLKTQFAELHRTYLEGQKALIHRASDGLRSVNESVPMPVHHESERTFSWSILWKISDVENQGAPRMVESVVTATMLYIKGTVLILYLRGPQGDLEWSRDESKKWAAQILAANPYTWNETAKERTGIDWGRAGIAGAQWGLIGLVVALGVRMYKKRKTSTAP